MFSCRYCEIFKNTYFEEHLRTAASPLREENPHSPCFVLPVFQVSSKKKSIWVKPGRTDRWWQNLFNHKLAEKECKKNLWMSKVNFLKLVNLIKPYAKEISEGEECCYNSLLPKGSRFSANDFKHIWYSTIYSWIGDSRKMWYFDQMFRAWIY